MSKTFRLSRRARLGWFAGLTVILIVSVGAVFGLTNDSLVDGEGSALAKQYTAVDADSAAAQGPEHAFPPRFGTPGKASTLVLYDTTGTRTEDAEMYAMATGNLVTHFGQADLKALTDYTPGLLKDYDAAVYLGTDYDATVPQALRTDVMSSDVPVMWVGENIDRLAGWDQALTAEFVARYGWNPHDSRTVPSDTVTSLRYEGKNVSRDPQGVAELRLPDPEDGSPVKTVAAAQCREHDEPTPCAGGDEGPAQLPWALRSGNLTYVAEIPLDFIDENDSYLIYSDLFYDLLAPETPGSKQAAVRLEDVGPEADPEDLRAVADYLHEAGVPFQVAVMPVQIGRTPDQKDWYGLSLQDRPRVVDALKYMQERGGTLIQHGTTHQYGAMDNPYSGRTGEDYEFYRYGCSTTAQEPYEFEKCENDSYIRQIARVAEDDVDQHVARLKHGRQIMIDAGLGEPKIFETPHYAASPNAYDAMAQVYDARYEQADYFAGVLSHERSEAGKAYSQHFPYSVHDIYGSTVYPENLGNITEAEQNNHAARDPDFLISRAKANLVVRESTASFFFHPYLDIDYLKDTVEGIQGLGYEFVPVTKLK